MMVHNPSDPQIAIEVRLLFDSGSQRSYIMEQFKGLDFADYSDGKSSLRVDVLIGSDYYW